MLSSDSVMVSARCDANNAHWRKKRKGKKKKFYQFDSNAFIIIILKLFTINNNTGMIIGITLHALY